ncbi:MAG: hypothetical protein PHT33_00250 [bacterium]|nr:hypothetical protein [bacterium]
MSCYQYLPYTLTLNSPAIITALGGDPNSSLSLPFIPGAAVRGAMAKILGDPGTDVSKQQEFYNLVLSGTVRYLHAYPAQSDRRALPMPVSVRREKDMQENQAKIIARDLASYDERPSQNRDLVEYWPKEQLAPIMESFLTIGSSRLTLVQPTMSTRIHHQQDRKKGCAWKDKQGHTHGAVFAFESLDAGQSFKGLIQVHGDSEEKCGQLAKLVQELLGELILIGRSRRAGYGGMTQIEWEERRKCEIEGSGGEGFQLVNCDIEPGTEFRLLLISACIVRDPVTGQIDPGGLEEEVGRALNNRAKPVCRRWTFETLGGFNRKWRLETPQVLAAAAGSVIVLKANQSIPINDLHNIEHEGIGERKGEGYGRLLFLKEPLRKISLYRPDKISLSSELGNKAPQLVSFIEGRIIDAQIIRRIEETAALIAKTADNIPTTSLLGRLRVPLRENPQRAIGIIKDWLQQNNNDKRLKRTAMDQLDRCSIKINCGKLSLSKWLVDASDKGKVLDWLQATVIAQRGHLISEKTAMQFLEEKSDELSVRLIDAVLAAMALRNKGKETGDE